MDNTVQSVERAFLILDFLRENGAGMGITHIASAVDLNTTTTHRLLRTLIYLDVVQQDPNNRIYKLAPKILLYGKAVLDSYDFIKVAHPILGELSKTVGETVFMGIHDNFELVYIDHVDSQDQVLRMTPQIGRRQPLHCTSLGKVLLSFFEPKLLQEYFSICELTQRTKNTITNPGVLKEELDNIRLQGFALDLEETEIGIRCVAAPIWRGGDQVVAAVSVSGPATRMEMKGLATSLRENVQLTSEKISETIIA
jgi:DNA-binding IclR family transcriptional regulator